MRNVYFWRNSFYEVVELGKWKGIEPSWEKRFRETIFKKVHNSPVDFLANYACFEIDRNSCFLAT
jgi:hypothetical protein